MEENEFDPLAERRSGTKSGFKAVLADKKWDDMLETREADRDRMILLQDIRRNAYGAPVSLLDAPSFSLAYQNSLKVGQRDSEDEGRLHSDKPASGSDEDFFLSYRANRLKELKKTAQLPRWGSVTAIGNRFDLPDVIDKTPPSCLALLLIWDNFEPNSLRWLDFWKLLAPLHPHTHFVSMRSIVASNYFDPIALPSISVYKGGDALEVCVRVHEESGIDRQGHVDDVEEWMVRKGWLSSTGVLLSDARSERLDNALFVREDENDSSASDYE